MSFRYLIHFKKFSTSRVLRESLLSANYKSKALWDERFSCKLLNGDEEIIRLINSKIILGNDLSNIEVDIFINIANPQSEEIAQLQESAKLLKRFRSSLYAHTLLPSTPHAICRLFLYSQRLNSLLNILDKRVEFGVFPDNFALNLLLDEALDKENYAAASRLASLVMLQEEFGSNQITDKLALYSVVKYIESKTDFSDWQQLDAEKDPILNQEVEVTNETTEAKEKDEEEVPAAEDDDDEDDAEYIRIPFLRNPYFDNHFDVTNPRILCGKTLDMLGRTLVDKNDQLASKLFLIGSVLKGDWAEAMKLTKDMSEKKFNLGPIKELSQHYIENLHGLDESRGEEKEKLLAHLKNVPASGDDSLSKLAMSECKSIGQFEDDDITRLKKDFFSWSEMRKDFKIRGEERLAREKLIEEIKAKKEELRLKEQYLYFYDNLKKSRVTRIEYN